jgi:hypothetical protein
LAALAKELTEALAVAPGYSDSDDDDSDDEHDKRGSERTSASGRKRNQFQVATKLLGGVYVKTDNVEGKYR